MRGLSTYVNFVITISGTCEVGLLYTKTIIAVRALDKDPVENDNRNGRITYSLQPDSDPSLPFSVETRRTATGYDGIIRVSR